MEGPWIALVGDEPASGSHLVGSAAAALGRLDELNGVAVRVLEPG
jgi:hypothetical protein